VYNFSIDSVVNQILEEEKYHWKIRVRDKKLISKSWGLRKHRCFLDLTFYERIVAFVVKVVKFEMADDAVGQKRTHGGDQEPHSSAKISRDLLSVELKPDQLREYDRCSFNSRCLTFQQRTGCSWTSPQEN
jgi:hypothetical protein